MSVRNFRKDSGWAWLVLCAAVVSQITTLGVSFSLSAYYVHWLESFGEGKSVTAWVGSINTGMVHFTGPFANVAIRTLGTRKTIIIASIVAAAGFIIGSCTRNILTLIICCGGFSGGALGVSFIAGLAIVGEYFEKWRSLAFGFAVTGIGIAPIILAPLQQYLIDSYTWRGALLISAGVVLNGCVVGAIMRDPPPVTHSLPDPASRRTSAAVSELRHLFDATLFGDSRFLLLCLSNLLWAVGTSPVIILFFDQIEGQGFSPQAAAFSFGVWGVMNIGGRVAGAAICHYNWVPQCSLHVYYLANIASGLFALLLAMPARTHWRYDAFVGAYGFHFGVMFAVWPTIAVVIFGQVKLTSVMGWLIAMEGVGYFVGAPLGGYFADVHGSTSVAYYVGGSVTMISGIILLPLPYFSRSISTDERRRQAVSSELKASAVGQRKTPLAEEDIEILTTLWRQDAAVEKI